MERRKKKYSSSYKGCKLFLSEDGLEVVKVDYGIASIPPFRIDVPLSSESIWFCAKTTRAEPDDKIELGEVLGPPCLPLGQYLGSRKILKVLMIHNNIDGIGQTFQIVSPNLKSFKDGKQFLIMYVVVQLHHSESVGVKGNWVNFIIFINNGEDCSESIVQVLWDAWNMNNFYFLFLLFSDFIGILFSFSFLFFWTMKRYVTSQSHDMSHDVMS